MEIFAILAAALFIGLILLARRRGKFDHIGPDDTPGDGIAEHMDGLVDQRTVSRPSFHNPMRGGGTSGSGRSGLTGGGGAGGSGGGGGGGAGGGF